MDLYSPALTGAEGHAHPRRTTVRIPHQLLRPHTLPCPSPGPRRPDASPERCGPSELSQRVSVAAGAGTGSALLNPQK